MSFMGTVASRVRQLHEARPRNAVYIFLAHLCSKLDEPIREKDEVVESSNDEVPILYLVLVIYRYHSVTEHSHAWDETKLEKIEIFSVRVGLESTTDRF